MKLIDYLPPVLSEIYEFKILCERGDDELSLVKDGCEKVRNELFVYTAEDKGLERLENMFGISYSPGDTAELRRFRILAALNGDSRSLKEKIRSLAGDDFTIDYYWREYRLAVKLPLKNKKYLEAVKDMLENTVPLNIVIDAALKYNTYGLLKNKGLAYGEWKSRGITYKGLREEEL